MPEDVAEVRVLPGAQQLDREGRGLVGGEQRTGLDALQVKVVLNGAGVRLLEGDLPARDRPLRRDGESVLVFFHAHGRYFRVETLRQSRFRQSRSGGKRSAGGGDCDRSADDKSHDEPGQALARKCHESWLLPLIGLVRRTIFLGIRIYRSRVARPLV